MIVGVCADKGSPGVTTLATALGLTWPGLRVLLEADPSGSDLPFRLRRPEGGALLPRPTVLDLVADSRMGLPPGALPGFAQPTSLGLPVVPGALRPSQFQPTRPLWDTVAAEAAAWQGTVITDLGRWHSDHAAGAMAREATVVVLVSRRPSAESLYHLRDRVDDLLQVLGRPDQEHPPLCVAVVAPARKLGPTADQVTRLLQAAALPVPVVGAVAEDPAGVAALLSGRLDRSLTRSALLRSAAALGGQVLTSWPRLAQVTAPAALPRTTAARGPGWP